MFLKGTDIVQLTALIIDWVLMTDGLYGMIQMRHRKRYDSINPNMIHYQIGMTD